MLVDSGAPGHYYDDELQPGMKDKLLSNKLLERTHKMVIAGRQVLRQVLLGTATGTVSGKIIGTESNKHQVNLEGFIVPGLGHHRSFTVQPAKTGISSIIDYRTRLD